jgi:hypothetical protein
VKWLALTEEGQTRPAEAGDGPYVQLVPFEAAYAGRSAFASATKPPLARRYVPFVESMRTYSRDRVGVDALAGLTVAALALPSAMAYAELAGLPVTAGLYALLLPVLAYAFFGTGLRVVVGPEAAVALLVASALAPADRDGALPSHGERSRRGMRGSRPSQSSRIFGGLLAPPES